MVGSLLAVASRQFFDDGHLPDQMALGLKGVASCSFQLGVPGRWHVPRQAIAPRQGRIDPSQFGRRRSAANIAHEMAKRHEPMPLIPPDQPEAFDDPLMIITLEQFCASSAREI